MSTLTSRQFKELAALAQERWGLHLSDKKRTIVTSRLVSFVRKGPFDSLRAYLDHLHTRATDEDMLAFFDVLSTNTTSFYRDAAHFTYIEREIYTALDRGMIGLPDRKFRVWSSACSTGPEPYTIAISALETLKCIGRLDYKILATDLSMSALRAAKAAQYPAKMFEGIDAGIVSRYFKSIDMDGRPGYEVRDRVRSMVTIRRLNLMEHWSMRGPFQIVFCRNVMIYFDHETRRNLVERFYDLLAPGGLLVLGSAETLSGLGTKFKPVAPSIYRR